MKQDSVVFAVMWCVPYEQYELLNVFATSNDARRWVENTIGEEQTWTMHVDEMGMDSWQAGDYFVHARSLLTSPL